MSFLAAAYVAASAYSAWNSYQAGKDEAEAYKDAARAKRIQAQKLMERYKINAEFTRLEGKAFMGKQKAAFASSGIDIGSGIALSAFEDTASKIERRIEIDEMEMQSQIDNILLGADLDLKKAGISQQAGVAGAVSTIGQAAFMMR